MERIRDAGRFSWALAGITVMVAVTGYVLWQVRVIFPPLVLAGALVFLLNPIVTWLQRRRVPRAAGAGLTYVGFAAGAVLVGFLVVPLAVDQAEALSDEWPEVRERVERWIDDRAADSEDWIIQLPTVEEIEDQLNGDRQDLGTQLEAARELGGQVFHVALIFILAPIIAFYLLVDLPHLRRVADDLLPAGAREDVLVVGRRLNRAIGGYFRGQLLVALIVGVMVSVGLFAIRLPFWLIIGMVAGLFNVIPLIGPWVGAIPGVVIALTTRDVSTALWVAVVMASAQQIDNHFISPLVMQRAVKLHPAAVMMALLAGGTLGGFFGLLLAVPTAAVLKILAGHLWRVYVLGRPLADLAVEWGVDDPSLFARDGADREGGGDAGETAGAQGERVSADA